MRYSYNAVDFLPISHNGHPIARPWGRVMGCQLWVWSLIYVLLLSSQYRWQYRDKLDRVITALDYICPRSALCCVLSWFVTGRYYPYSLWLCHLPRELSPHQGSNSEEYGQNILYESTANLCNHNKQSIAHTPSYFIWYTIFSKWCDFWKNNWSTVFTARKSVKIRRKDRYKNSTKASIVIVCIHEANEKWRYNVTSSLIGSVHTPHRCT